MLARICRDILGRRAGCLSATQMNNPVLCICVVHFAELTALIADLRSEGSDTAEVEVKRAAKGFPNSIEPTLSAFANTPGGGILIFGLDEDTEFTAVGVYDRAACKSTLASKARQAVTPPITFEVWDFDFEEAPIVAAKIHELPAHGKPCHVSSTGKAYLRSYDGDYQLSQIEEQAFIANRSTPIFDQQPMPGTGESDLHPKLLAAYLSSCRSSSSALAGLAAPHPVPSPGLSTKRFSSEPG